MRYIAFIFFLAAVVSVTSGMGWGIQMAISEDHLLAPAHAHLNLVGWTTLALFGLYYRLTPTAAQGILPRVHAGLAILGVALMTPGIAMVIVGGSPALASAGAILTLASMLLFLVTVARHGLGAAA